MKGEELRRIMKLRRIKTTEAAHALGIHPQTIRNLWAKDEVPRLYLMALTSYVWALGFDPAVLHREKTPALDKAVSNTRKVLEVYAKDKNPQVAKEAQVVLGGDLWSKLR